MSSYPPGGDYDERLLDSIPKATKAERQEGYNVNLLASDTSETPINARPAATVDGHTSVEAGTPPTKEGYISPYSVPWYRQKKWKIFMLLGGILLIGGIAGGVAGGVVASKNRNKSPSTTNTTTTTSSSNAATQNSGGTGAVPGSSPVVTAPAGGADTSSTSFVPGDSVSRPTPPPSSPTSTSTGAQIVRRFG